MQMVQAIWEQVQELLALGRDSGNVGAIAMMLRAVVVYASTLAIVRLGSERFLSQATAFDVMVAIMLGSVMSSAITGSAPFVPTLLGGGALVGLHALLAALAFKSDWFGPLVNGEPVLPVEDGEVQEDGMRRTGLSSRDLSQALRQQGKPPDPSKARLAYLERDGSISIVSSQERPRILDVSVRDGVQTVRMEFG
jgi:uncharacterized membrane protein YcaP (DUF421 family)